MCSVLSGSDVMHRIPVNHVSNKGKDMTNAGQGATQPYCEHDCQVHTRHHKQATFLSYPKCEI